MLRYIRVGIGVLVAVLIIRGVGVRTQSGSAPILVVINNSSSNRFGPYLSEILKAEGLNSHSVVQLSTVTSTTLNSASVVVLAETTLTSAQATMFSNFVAGGGRLVAMKPDAQLLPVLGLSSAGSTTTEGYFAVNVANAFADGFPTTTLPFHGQAQNDTPAQGTQVLAWLYSNSATPTPYPAVLKSGRTVTWTYDLARSVAYTRQGNPANASDRDGTPPYRTEDIFYNAIDKDKVSIPYADVQMRMFARAIGDLMTTAMPLPSLWYFPGTNKTLVVLTGDSHANPESYFDNEIAAIESFGGRISIYAYNGTSPSLSSVNAWKSNGHEVGMHPAGYQYSRTLTDAFQANQDWFTGMYAFNPSATTRVHQLEWQGWVDAAKVQANFGIGMDTSYYTWGPAITYADGHQAHGYINGSGQPMRFIDQNGAIVPVYQQVTSLIDEALVISDFSEHLTPDQATGVSRQLIDNSQAGDYAAIMTQFHVDYFAFGEVNPWALGTMDYARSLNIPMWTTERWLKYTQDRNAATMSGYSWSAASRQLQFSITIPSGAEAHTVALPGAFGGFGVTTVTIDGSTTASSPQTITGRPMNFLSIAAGTHTVVVTYNTPVPPPQHTPIAVNDSAAVNEANSVTISVLANDSDADGDTLSVTSAGPDSGADIVINPNQTITYTPHALTCGIDSFPYSISDGRGGSATATVTVTVTCLNGQMTQQTFADFSPSCAVPTNTIVTRLGDGELRLAGVQGDEYTQSTLNNALWTAATWSGGAYTPTIVNSVMSLSNSAGAFVRSAGTLPVTTLEASVNFTAQPWEHVGWGSLNFAGAYAIFSTYNQSSNLYARTSPDGVTEQQTNLGALRGGFHTYRIDRKAASGSVDTISYYIDGALVAQHSVATLPVMYVYQSNNGGTAHTLDIDRIWVYPNFRSSGSYQSCTQDIGHNLSAWTTADWSATVPVGTTVRMRTRTSTNGTTWSGWSAPMASSGQDITSPAGRYLQYLLEFTSTTGAASASVDSVTVHYADSSGSLDHAPIAVSDAASTTEGNPVTVAVLANDTDPDNDVLTVTSVTQGSKGGVVINGGQSVTYTPNGTSCGADAFSYTISDGRGKTSTATVSVNTACLTGRVTQSSFNDFGPSCAVRTDTLITQQGDGEVRLAGTQDDSYSDPALDATRWVAGTWAGGTYQPTLSNGVMSIANVDGAFVRSASAMAVSTIEASVRFAPLPWQHVGWASLDFGGQYAMFSTYNTSTDLFARTFAGGGGELQTNLGPISPGFHAYRVTRQTTSPSQDTVNYYVDGALVASHLVSTLTSMYVYQSHNGGASQTLDIDSVSVYPAYKNAGTFQSCTVDGGVDAFTWTTASWTNLTASGTSVQLSTRTSTDGSSWSVWSAPLTASGSNISSPAGRYLQYQLQLGTNNPSQSPVIDSVTFGLTRSNIDSTPPALSNISVSGITSGTAVVTWTTDEAATSQVEYGQTRAYGETTAVDATPVTAHSQTLTGLSAGTLYNFRVISVDSAGNEADSGNFTFTTPSPTMSISDVTVNEPASGTATAVFTVSLSAPASQTVTVSYATANGTAQAGTNYTTTSGTLTFNAGDDAKSISVPVLNDGAVTSNLTFFVNLSGAANATIADAQGAGTIVNSTAASLSINNVTITEPASGTANANFTVTLSQALSTTVAVNYATADGTAVAGTNYTATSGTLSFSPGSTTRTISVPVRNDGLYSPQNLTFTVNLSGATAGATISQAQGTGTIVNANNASITVTSPTSGSTWIVGTVQTISWTNNLGSAATVRLDVSRDGGSTWTTIAPSVQNTTATAGSFNWTVTSPTASSARVRAVWTANTSVVGSTGNFTIANGTMSVTVPATGATWAVGSSQTITWTNNLGSSATVRLDVSRDAGVTWTTIAPSVQNTSASGGSFNWTVTSPTTTLARVRAVWTANTSVLGSSGNFTIANGAITVTAPAAGANWAVGSVQTITWSNNLGSSATVRLDVSRDAGTTWTTIAPSVRNTSATGGSFNWTVTSPATTTARIRAVWTTNTAVVGSTGDFAIANGTINVTAPTTGASLVVGAVQTISWTNNLGSGASVRLDVSRDGGVTWNTIASSVQNSSATGGSFNWTVTSPTTTTAQIRAVWTANGTIVGSTGNFTIGTGTMSVTAPATGSTLIVGAPQTITWANNLGPSATVRLDVSRDGGATWATIASSVQNSSATGGSFNWTVTSPASTTARIRAVWTANTSVVGSTGNFTIVNGTMSITAPATGTTWTIGTVQTISWTNNLGPTATVRIDRSLNGGFSWTTIAASVQNSSATGGSFSWTVSGSATTTARIRAVWTTNTNVSASSGNFTLR